MWHMPLDDEYKELLKSAFADLANIGGRWGGAISAAWFLREFVGDTPWVHLDIAGHRLARRRQASHGQRPDGRVRANVREARAGLVGRWSQAKATLTFFQARPSMWGRHSSFTNGRQAGPPAGFVFRTATVRKR